MRTIAALQSAPVPRGNKWFAPDDKILVTISLNTYRIWPPKADTDVTKQKMYYSLFNQRHREESLMLFEILMNTNTWTDFTKNAAFFRTKLNEGVYLYAMYVAVIHSELANGLVLPPLYEVTPHMFTNSETIHNAYTAKMEQVNRKFKVGEYLQLQMLICRRVLGQCSKFKVRITK